MSRTSGSSPRSISPRRIRSSTISPSSASASCATRGPDEGVVEARAAFARAVARARRAAAPACASVRAEQRAERAPELGRAEASASSLPCHARSVYRRRVVTRRLWLGLGLWLLRWSRRVRRRSPSRRLPPVSGGKVRVRVFTEPAPVKTVGDRGAVLVRRDRGCASALGRQGRGAHDDRRSRAVGRSRRRARDRSRSQVDVDPDRRRARALRRGRRGVYGGAAPPAALGIDYAAIAKEGVASLASCDGRRRVARYVEGLGVREREGRLGRDADQGSDPRVGARSRGLAVDRDEDGAGRAQAERRVVQDRRRAGLRRDRSRRACSSKRPAIA